MATFCTSDAFWYDPTPTVWHGGRLSPPPIAPGAAESGWLIVPTGIDPCGKYGGSHGQTLLARTLGDGTFTVLRGSTFIEGEGPFLAPAGDLYCYSFGPNYDNTDPPQNLPAPPDLTAAGMPELLAQIAFVTDYNDTTPTWVDVTGYVESLEVDACGRRDERAQSEKGTCSMVLRNTDDRFTADNPSSPYAGYIRPLRRVRVGVTVNGTYYPRFTGFADAFVGGWASDGGHAICTVTASDRFKLYEKQTDTLNSRPDEAADVRITALLQHAGIGSGDRIINADALAARTVATYDYEDDTPLLGSLLDAAFWDGGLLFMDGYGRTVFQTVKYRQIGGATRARTSQARFGNDPTSIGCEADIDPQVNDALMASRVTGSDCNGDPVEAIDATLRTSDGPAELELGGLWLLPTDAQDRVDDELALRKNPTPRYDRLTVDVLTLPALDQEAVLARENSDRITVAIIPPDLTSGTERDQWIEKISDSVQIIGDSPKWTTTFALSSAGDAVTVIP